MLSIPSCAAVVWHGSPSTGCRHFTPPNPPPSRGRARRGFLSLWERIRVRGIAAIAVHSTSAQRSRRSPMPEPPLLLQREPPVATVIFNRPEARNALNEAMQLALSPMLTQLHEDADIRVLILRAIPKISTPESRHFSASNRCRRFTGDS